MRALLLVAALLGAAWLVVEERGAVAADKLTRQALRPGGAPHSAQLRQARELERTATRLSPDVRPGLDVGILELRAGRFRAAGARFAAATRREPENVDAWALLGVAALHYDRSLAAAARARLRALEPPVVRVR